MKLARTVCALLLLSATPHSAGSGGCQEVENVTFSGIQAEPRLLKRHYFSSALQYVDEGSLANPSYATKILVFGGRMDGGEVLNDAVSLDPRESSKHHVHPFRALTLPVSGTGMVETLNVSGDIPAGRWGHTGFWTGAGSATPPTRPPPLYSTSGHFTEGQTFTHQGHDYRREPAAASGTFQFENSGPGPCVGGVTSHVILNGGECATDHRGCSCVTLKVTSRTLGSPDSDTIVSDITSPHYPSMWSGWRIQVTSGPGTGYDGVISWNQGSSYNMIPAIHLQLGELSTFLITDRSDPRKYSIPQNSLWVFGGRLGDGTVTNDMYVLNTRQDGLTAGSAADGRVFEVEDFSFGNLGWTDVGTFICGSLGPVLGGVGQLGFPEGISKVYVVNNPHTSVSIELDVVKIDSWADEALNLYADGTLLWSRQLATQPSDSNECGLESMGEEVVHVNVTWQHTSPSLTLELNVSGTPDSSEHLWWGIRDVVVTTLPRGMGWRLVAAAGDVPSARAHHASAAFQDLLFVFGGSNATDSPPWDEDAASFWDPVWSAGSKQGDCFAFNTSSESWTQISTAPDGPGPRSHHSMVLGLADGLVLYGGQDPAGKLLEDVIVLAARTGEWITPQVVGPGPGRLAGHSATVSGDRMWVFGGFRMDPWSRNARLEDGLHSLHLGAYVWQAHSPLALGHGAPVPWPGRRYGHALVLTLHGGMVVLGGAYTGDGDGLVSYGDVLRLTEACVDAAEVQSRRREVLRRGELLMACDSMEELDWVEEEAGRLEEEAAGALERLEMRLTASYLAAVKRREQYETDREWFELGVQTYTDQVARQVAEGRVYTDNLADLEQARRNRLEMEEAFVGEMQRLEASKLGLHMQLDQTKDRYAKAIAAIRGQGAVLARKKAEGAISAGRGHACAINALDLVQCWGRNDIGQASPPSGTRFKSVSAGDHLTCGIRVGDRKVECWGSDSFGKLGRGAKPGKGKEALVSGSGRPAQQVSVGGGHVCVLTEDGAVECWGDNRDGQTEVPCGGSGTWLMVSSGTSHSCAIRARTDDERKRGLGEVVCWGSAVDGRTQGVKGRAKWVSAGGKHGCAVMDDSRVQCWGRGKEGQAAAPAGDFFSTVSCGLNHNCGMLTNGGVKCWGANQGGESSAPTRRVKSVASGEAMSCAIDALEHRVVCWGRRSSARAEVVTCSRVWVT